MNRFKRVWKLLLLKDLLLKHDLLTTADVSRNSAHVVIHDDIVLPGYHLNWVRVHNVEKNSGLQRHLKFIIFLLILKA